MEIVVTNLDTGTQIDSFKLYEDHITNILSTGSFGDNSNTYDYGNSIANTVELPLVTSNVVGSNLVGECGVVFNYDATGTIFDGTSGIDLSIAYIYCYNQYYCNKGN